MKNRLMAAIEVLLVSISCIASTACVCSAASPVAKKLPETKKTETTAKAASDSEEKSYSFSTIDSFDLYYRRPLSHVTNEYLALGNDEQATLTLVCSPANRTDEDFIFLYDRDVISTELIDIEDDEENNLSKITFYVNKVKPGETDFTVCPGFDYYAASVMGKDVEESVAMGTLHFINLDEKDGKVVYVSDKEHTYSADKAKMGKDAEETTLYDVVSLGYTEK